MFDQDDDRSYGRHDRRILIEISDKIGELMTTVEEVQASLAALTADLDSLATTAKAEFEKLEKEISEGQTQPNLEPLKSAIDALDAKARAAAAEVPTS